MAELADYRKLRGELTSVESFSAGNRGRYGVERVHLRSSTGLTATGWVYHPTPATGCHPAVLLQNGREENADVIARLPVEFGDVVVLSLDYPAAMPYVLRLRDVVRDRARIRQASRQIPALFSLGAAYLRQRADVDSTRIALAATSFAVPFASIAAAFDTSFRNIALIYGAGDLPRVIAANLTLRPRVLRRPLAWLATRPFAEFAPERFIGRIAPRPVVMVNGIDDPQMPAEAVRQLYDAARQPKSIAWLSTGHLMPTDSALIRALVDTAFARIPLLHEPDAPARCGDQRPAASDAIAEPPDEPLRAEGAPRWPKLLVRERGCADKRRTPDIAVSNCPIFPSGPTATPWPRTTVGYTTTKSGRRADRLATQARYTVRKTSHFEDFVACAPAGRVR